MGNGPSGEHHPPDSLFYTTLKGIDMLGYQVCNTCGIKKPLTRDFFGQRTDTATIRWRKKCRECTNEYNKYYASLNPRSVKERATNRRSRLDKWLPDDELKLRLYKEQNSLCALCGEVLQGHWSDSTQCQVDHLVPVLQGGDNNEENLVIAHRKCNLEKGAKNLLEYIRWREAVGLPRSNYWSEKTLRCIQKAN